MKTSLDELQLIENCLLGRAPGEQQALFEAKLLLDPELREDVYWRWKTYGIVREYGRKQLYKELEKVHHTLFTKPKHQSFRDKVLGFFRK